MSGEREKRVKEIAFYREQFRHRVRDMCQIELCGSQEDDYYRAEDLVKTFKMLAKPALYSQQINDACRAYKVLFGEKRNLLAIGPFQVGKTGISLGLAELFLHRCEMKNQHGLVIYVPLVGKRDHECQTNDRITQYGYLSHYRLFRQNVNVFRCNSGQHSLRMLQNVLRDTNEKNPILLIPDEMQHGTAVNSRFDKMILRELPKLPHVRYLGLSATPFEQQCSKTCMDYFSHIEMELYKGYTGPSMIRGQCFPCADDYVEKDVDIREELSHDFDYYSGGFDQSRLESLLNYVMNSYDLSNVAIRFNKINTAEIAAKIIKRKYPTICHYGKFLNTELGDKWESGGCLVVVNSMTCSMTLPDDVSKFIDAASFHLAKEKATIATVGQGPYGRMCGNRPVSQLICASGTKEYIERGYKKKTEFAAPLHGRVKAKKAKSRSDKYIKILYHESGKDTFGADEVYYCNLTLLQECYDKFKKGRSSRDRKGDNVTKEKIFNIMGDYDNFNYQGVKTHGGQNPKHWQNPVRIMHDGDKVVGLMHHTKAVALPTITETEYVVSGNSIFHEDQVSDRFGI